MPTAPPPSQDVAVETQVFWLRFRKEIAAVAIILLLAGVAFAGFRIYSVRREATAAESLAKAKGVYDYQQVITNYPGTAAGASAHLLLADAQRAEKKFTEANATLQNFISKYPDHELVGTARMALAANLESMGKTDEALATYQQIATSDSKGFNAPLALISRVYLLKAKGKTDEALQTCEKIMTDYRDSMWAREAMAQMSSLKPKVSSVPVPLSTSPNQAAPPLLARPSAVAPKSAPTPGDKKPK
jgi:predicted negative regulator of RcsB-dependent stress response